MRSQKINGIPVIYLESIDFFKMNSLYFLLQQNLSGDTKAVLDFSQVTTDLPLGNLFREIKYFREQNGVQLVAINVSSEVIQRAPGFCLLVYSDLINALFFLTKKRMIQCKCGVWLPLTKTAISLGEKWYWVYSCPSCQTLYRQDGQAIIYGGEIALFSPN